MVRKLKLIVQVKCKVLSTLLNEIIKKNRYFKLKLFINDFINKIKN